MKIVKMDVSIVELPEYHAFEFRGGKVSNRKIMLKLISEKEGYVAP